VHLLSTTDFTPSPSTRQAVAAVAATKQSMSSIHGICNGDSFKPQSRHFRNLNETSVSSINKTFPIMRGGLQTLVYASSSHRNGGSAVIVDSGMIDKPSKVYANRAAGGDQSASHFYSSSGRHEPAVQNLTGNSTHSFYQPNRADDSIVFINKIFFVFRTNVFFLRI
jgi:hypothetical protein